MANKNGLPSENREESNAFPIGDTRTQIRYAPTDETDIYYPESDGKPMAETERHRDALIDALQTLMEHFKDVPDICVSGNMMMYYVEGHPRKSISPDVFVTFGVVRKERRIYRIWEEGSPPDFVLEFSSGNTYRNDLREKKTLYAEIGIREYFLYDAERRYLPSPLIGFRLVGRDYVAIPTASDGSVPSTTLGLTLRLRDTELGFYNPISERWLETPAKAAAARAEQAAVARRNAEIAAQQETEARQRAEAELARLRAEIEHLKTLSTSPKTNPQN
jgi:Uma2 family endonuclease